MQSSLSPDSQDSRERARFHAIRKKIFGEMGQAAAKWRLAWILPFHLLVLTLLIVRGEPLWRAAVQAIAIFTSAILFMLQVLRPAIRVNMATLFVGSLSMFSALAVTGGLASPMLISAVLILAGGGIAVSDPRWLRSAFFGFYIALSGVLALLSRTPVGALASPLAPAHGYSTPEYVTISLMSVVLTAVAIFRMGCSITKAYERVAFELAERREELCTENEDRTRALEGIAARLAHEVKNPLAAIKGLSTHMARNSADPKVAERLGIVAAEADRLQAIVDGFLSFSRGLDDLKVSTTHPYEIARELVLLLETRAADHGVTLEVAGVPELSVNADARKLRQALLNLVLNAMQASHKGGRVRVEIARACGGIAVKVRDEGAGMTADVLDRIRKPYFTTKDGGSGLGVAVARGLIEQHGGHLRYDSAPGRGTTATIELPPCALKMCQGALPKPFRPSEKLKSEVPVEATAR